MKLPWRKRDWYTYTFHRKRWPEDIYSWTYTRREHPFMWMFFGNDRDGCTPWVHGKQWSWFRWWLRNRTANFNHCIIGLAEWKEGVVGDDAWLPPILERKFWKGDMTELEDGYGFILSGVRKPVMKVWLPYIRIPLPFNFSFWWGWKPTKGHHCCSLTRGN
jgi:hypothetical protein